MLSYWNHPLEIAASLCNQTKIIYQFVPIRLQRVTSLWENF